MSLSKNRSHQQIIPTKVAVGLSGGVDSSVAALMLKEQGYDVFGIFMSNWNEPNSNECHSAEDARDAKRVCMQIGIPFYAIDHSQEYWDRVFRDFLTGYQKGLTPNPDILCNREIKFDALMKSARALGAEKLATGHYARVNSNGQLLRGVDSNKDQSYFLHSVGSKILKDVLFPLGSLNKTEVKEIASLNGFDTAEKKESMGICFIGKKKFKDFLGNYLEPKPGRFVTPNGNTVGEHQGAQFYTIGQRRGLGIGGAGDRWFVVEKDIEKNEVFVVQGDRDPTMMARGLSAVEPFWISGDPPNVDFDCTAKIRYRQRDQKCHVQTQGESLLVTFEEPQRAIAPGQSVVFYRGDVCLGGAVIESVVDRLAPIPSLDAHVGAR